MNGYSAFSKGLALLEPHHQIVLYYIQETYQGTLPPSAAMQSVYSAANWASYKGVLHIPLSSKTEASPSICLMLYRGNF